jgi:hypothetical protein
MARVKLAYGAAYRGELPPVCMKCGAEATEYRTKMFSLSPFGLPIIILPFMIYFPGRMWVRGPFCHVHKNYWRWRLAFISAALLGAIALVISGLVLIISDTPPNQRRPHSMTGLLCCGFLAALVALAAWIIWLQYAGLRLAAHTKTTVTLAGVSEAFVEAVEPPVRLS